MPKTIKAPSVIFVTDRIKDKPGDAALIADAENKFPHAMDKPELYAQPDHCPIQTPADFAEDFHQSERWRLGIHEAGHALASLLFVGRVDVLTLTSIDGCEGLGHSYSCGAHGEDGCKVSVGGLAAERLVEGKPFDIGGFTNDMKNARPDLRGQVYTKYPLILKQIHDATAHLYGADDWMEYWGRLESDANGMTDQAQRRQWGEHNHTLAIGNFEAAARLMHNPASKLRLRDGWKIPTWDGQPVERLAVLCLIGYGDEILQGRYLRGLCECAEHVSVIVSSPLFALFKKNAPSTVDVFAASNCSDCLDLADAFISSMALSHYSGQGYGDASWIVSSSADDRSHDATVKPARVGIVWTGNQNDPFNRLRSIEIAKFAPLFKIPGVEWHSLQIGPNASECPKGMIDHTHELHDFTDTVDLVASLDLVIAVDTAVANLV